MLRELGKNTILFFLGLLVALAMVEVVLRIYNPLGFTMRGNKILLPVNRTQIIHNLQGGRLDELVINKKNSIGFRGEGPPADFKAWLTIVTVGGSTTECLAINEEKSWPHLVQEKLKTHFSKLWLNNAGLGGHSTFGHIILMQDFLIKIKPKLVLFLVGINDLGRSDISNSDRNLWGFGFQKFETALMVGANHSGVISTLLNLYRFYFPAYTKLSEIDEIDIRTLKPKEIAAAKEEAIIAKDRQNYLPDYRLRLEKLIDLARQNRIDSVLITQPALYGKGVDDITGVRLDNIDVYGATNGQTGWRELELYNEVTRQVGKERDVLVIDLARELPKSSLYYYDLVHYSNEGCAKVSEIIFSHLLPYMVKKYPNYYRGTERASISERKP
ncbi:MAG: SGNH/GDSL hydrolase family protein [Desulfobaccales bacterium]